MSETHDLAEIAASGAMFRLFTEVAFAEPPARVPLLPKPGTYKHPSYGEITLTPERIANFVRNLNAAVYQRAVPIDAEHQSKLSGALGYFSTAALNDDGSADAEVEWTDRGKALLAAGGFKYVSPEWYDRWTDPATEVEHQDVLVGLALTSRPFFKDGSLRPLVAREGELVAAFAESDLPDSCFAYVPDAAKGADGSKSLRKLRLCNDAGEPDARIVGAAMAALGPGGFRGQTVDIPAAARAGVMARVRAAFAKANPGKGKGDMPDHMQMTEPDDQPKGQPMSEKTFTEQEYNELRGKVETLTQQFTEADTLRKAAEADAKTFAERLGTLEAERRRDGFIAEVTGKSAANGHRWFGEVDKHVAILESLGDEHRQLYIEQQRAIAQQVKAFAGRELGSDAGNPDGSAEAAIKAKATALAAQKGITYAVAFTEVMDTDTELARRYYAERPRNRTEE